jgi:putative addiction module component (TIGR02574 family)
LPKSAQAETPTLKTMVARKTAGWYKSPMTALAQTVLEEAMRLPSVDRAMLIEKLISSFDAAKRKTIDAAWVAESEDRLNAYRTGKLTARPFEDVMKDLNA